MDIGVVVVVGGRAARYFMDRVSRTDSKLTSNKAVGNTMEATRDEIVGREEDRMRWRE